jgi:transketolase
VSTPIDFDPRILRRHIIEMAFAGQTVHSPCALSIVEILSALYGSHLRFDPADPQSPDRDRLVLSKGHGVMALYACFRQIGWMTDENLRRYNQDGTLYHGLAECKVPGIEASTGSLGHGFPVAVGMALGFKRQGRAAKVACVVGDGEFNEGPNFEAMLFAAHQGLDALTLIIDANQFQAMGRTHDVLNLEPLPAKLAAFGFDTHEVDGHDLAALQAALAAPSGGRPKGIVARTIKGKGIGFMEGDNRWHYTRLSPADHAAAMQQLGGGHA